MINSMLVFKSNCSAIAQLNSEIVLQRISSPMNVAILTVLNMPSNNKAITLVINHIIIILSLIRVGVWWTNKKAYDRRRPSVI